MEVLEPRRISHTYSQRLVAPPDEVFPLLCPVLETQWAEGWHPTVVYSRSGVAEKDCIFVTSDPAGDEVWIITVHDPGEHHVEMVMVAPARIVTQIAIRLRAGAPGCAAEITYTKTSLGPAGDAELAGFTDEAWQDFMMAWERELNEYLKKSE